MLDMEKARARSRKHYWSDIEKSRDLNRQKMRKLYEKNRVRILARIKEKRSNPEYLEKERARRRKQYHAHGGLQNSTLVGKYGITVKEYENLNLLQKGLCAICGNPETGRNKRLSVDHDHTNKKRRGLLCNNCNNGLGRFKDSIVLVRKAMLYLESYGTK